MLVLLHQKCFGILQSPCLATSKKGNVATSAFKELKHFTPAISPPALVDSE
jgi:hypothetical protein